MKFATEIWHVNDDNSEWGFKVTILEKNKDYLELIINRFHFLIKHEDNILHLKVFTWISYIYGYEKTVEGAKCKINQILELLKICIVEYGKYEKIEKENYKELEWNTKNNTFKEGKIK